MIRGWGPIGMLNLRCVVVLVVVNLMTALGAVYVVGIRILASDGVVAGVAMVVYLAIHVVELPVPIVAVGAVVAGVGIPAGVVAGRALRGEAHEWVHVLAFAAVGAVLAAAICSAVAAAIHIDLGVAAAWAALEGAVGAGGARWWSGAACRKNDLATAPRRADADR
ncbi:hypothetical protein [Cellulomonas sp. PhB150]|uniref:hypothetical protein n=1 Tax=Cellulomonas sp. PhB150 TaxID=2485188 RepID=UPI0011CEB05E|nr:hypothetical protein [Cellulomonas sp. PhB150]